MRNRCLGRGTRGILGLQIARRAEPCDARRLATDRLAAARRAVVRATACVAAAAAAPAHAADAPAQDAPRVYAGLAVAALDFGDRYGGVKLSDSSVGPELYGGWRLNDRLSLELSYGAFDAIDLHDVAGSGVSRFDVRTELHAATLAVVREISMQDLFDWRRDWRLFGTVGLYEGRLDRTVAALGSGTVTREQEADAGGLVGIGVLYRLGRVELRGYVRADGTADDGGGRELGAAAQLRF